MAEAIPRTCYCCGCTESDCSGCINRSGAPCYWVGDDLCSACDGLVLPAAMTPAIAEVLDLMCFTGSLAELYRVAGTAIARRVEDEQAFILWRFLRLAIVHDDSWRQRSNEDVERQLAIALSKNVAAP